MSFCDISNYFCYILQICGRALTIFRRTILTQRAKEKLFLFDPWNNLLIDFLQIHFPTMRFHHSLSLSLITVETVHGFTIETRYLLLKSCWCFTIVLILWLKIALWDGKCTYKADIITKNQHTGITNVCLRALCYFRIAWTCLDHLNLVKLPAVKIVHDLTYT